jgi:hypothetical protein
MEVQEEGAHLAPGVAHAGGGGALAGGGEDGNGRTAWGRAGEVNSGIPEMDVCEQRQGLFSGLNHIRTNFTSGEKGGAPRKWSCRNSLGGGVGRLEERESCFGNVGRRQLKMSSTF